MRTPVMFGLVASTLAVALVAVVPSPACAAEQVNCGESATVSAGVPDLLSNSLIGNPLNLNVPLFGTPDLFTGPSCNLSIVGPTTPVDATISVASVAGLVSGKMAIRTSAGGTQTLQDVSCGPAYQSCEATVRLYPPAGRIVDARCSVSGVIAAFTGVSCSLRPVTF